ncbi:MAG: formyltetrahydrofolate deformylase [Alphaproteobacteria bacterium HGW-Alphaproteobacteria-13]|jgi:formyltetrahydrofolate deformylase|nr:MAG: formyltetrahydrofolate deformylase [Alphaproteobacteria bacterium HGW-Alphaproteobacteria-13]
MSGPYILTFSCADAVGIVAAVTGLLAERDGFILDSQQYANLDSGRFFMRVEFRGAGPRFPAGLAEVRQAFAPVVARFGMDAQIRASAARPRFVIAVSQGSHCLNDLLHRWSTGNLAIDIIGVVSNHEHQRRLSEWHGVPFHHLPVSDANRAEQEAAILDVMARGGAEYLVLARYMQVLSGDLTARLAGRCINIHHSFLPGFKGAKPYHRAHERGVKLIGATAHFVTGDLDEGPIIEQAVDRVDHRASVEDLIRTGRDIEAQVLARAVRWVAEQRVLIDGRKTVVFR